MLWSRPFSALQIRAVPSQLTDKGEIAVRAEFGSVDGTGVAPQLAEAGTRSDTPDRGGFVLSSVMTRVPLGSKLASTTAR